MPVTVYKNKHTNLLGVSKFCHAIGQRSNPDWFLCTDGAKKRTLKLGSSLFNLFNSKWGQHSNLVWFLHTDTAKQMTFKLDSSLKAQT